VVTSAMKISAIERSAESPSIARWVKSIMAHTPQPLKPIYRPG
jgi:hypothetical protein